MRRVAAALILALLCLGGRADAWLIGKGLTACEGGPGYCGPGDIIEFTAWYGMRGYSQAFSLPGTGKAINIRRTSDSATTDINILSTGNLDVATAATFCAATTCFVTTAYDQTGGNACGGSTCDVVQGTASRQPQLLLSGCSGSLPCLESLAGAQFKGLRGATDFTPAGTKGSLSAVGNRSSGTQVCQLMGMNNSVTTDAADGNSVGCYSTADVWRLTGNAEYNAAATDAAWHAVSGVVNTTGPANALNIDGVETLNAVITFDTSAGRPTIAFTLQFGTLTLQWAEGGFKDDVAWSSTIRNALCHNKRLYWGTGGSC